MTSAKNAARVFEYLSLQSEGLPIEKTSLNKLLYFAQGHALSELGHELFPNQIDAWDHGPVVAVVYTGYDKIVESAEREGISDVQMAPEELEIIMDVWNKYKGYSAKSLVDMTHEAGTPWAATYEPGVKNIHIPVDLIQEYFLRPENRLERIMDGVKELPTVDALPADEYDPKEDSVWEALLNDAE